MGEQLFWLGTVALFVTSVQSSNSLHYLYGSPTREEFSVRRGISVTVQYGRDLEICAMRIHPTSTSLVLKGPEKLLRPELVTEVIDELVPIGDRGKGGLQPSVLEEMGCSVYSVYDFEHVTIARWSHECLPLQPARELPALVTFKKPECTETELQ